MATGSSTLGLGIVLQASGGDAAARQFKQLGDAVGGATKTLDAAKKAMGELAVGGAMFGAGAGGMMGMAGLAKGAGALDKQLERVRLTAQASSADMARMDQAVMAFGAQGLAAPIESAKSLENLAAAGFNAKASLQMLKPALDLSIGGSISAESAVNALSSAMKVFSLDTDQASMAVDQMFVAAQTTGLQPKDLENAIGTVARGASAVKAGMGDTLSMIGLVKNTGVAAEVAASSVSSAMLHVAESSKKFKALGVNVVDANNEFRPLLEIILETEGVLLKRFPNAAERAAKSLDLYSKFGMTAAQAIGTQLGKGVEDSTGKVYKGAAGIAFLRQQMEMAGGSAEQFSKAMLEKDPWGRLTVIWDTLSKQVGRGFLTIFGPAVSKLADGVAKLTTWFGALPEPVKRTASAILVGVAAFVALSGAIILGVAAFKLLAIGAGFAGLTMSGLLLTMLPIVAAFGAVSLLAAGIFVAFKGNVGGLGDIISGGGARIRMAFDAISMLFSRGGFTKKMWDSLNQPGNEGVLQFALHVYHWGGVIKNFLKSVWEGFKAAIEVARPSFQALGSALWTVGEALGIVDKEFPVDAAGRWDKFGAAAKKAGEALGKLAGILAKGLAVGINTAVTAAGALRKAWDTQSDTLKKTVQSYGELDVHLQGIAKNLGIVSEANQQGNADWLTLDNVLGGTASALLAVVNLLGEIGAIAVGAVLSAVRIVTSLLSGIWDVLGGLLEFVEGVFTLRWDYVWRGLGRIVYGVVNGIVQALLSFVQVFASIIGPLMKSLGMGDAVALIEDLKRSTEGDFKRWFGQEGQITGAPQAGAAMYGALPKAASAPGGMSMSEPGVGGMSLPLPVSMSSPGGANASSEELHRDLQAVLVAIKAGQVTNVSIDGEVVARAAKRESRADAVSSFDPGVSFSSGE
jgi:TP901 family phage tail tape measure protein